MQCGGGGGRRFVQGHFEGNRGERVRDTGGRRDRGEGCRRGSEVGGSGRCGGCDSGGGGSGVGIRMDGGGGGGGGRLSERRRG